VANKDPKMIILGARIKELRELAGLSREQVADAAGVSFRAVVQWEVGSREPGWFNMVALSKALGVSCDEFNREPTVRPPATRGRPRKMSSDQLIPRRPRARRKKEK
jgi:transcriptional regulator with XRE-family HTH domain